MVVPFRKIKICKHQCFSDVVQGALQHFIHFITSLSYQLGFHTIALIFTYQSFSKQQQRRNIRNSPLLYRIFGEIILEHGRTFEIRLGHVLKVRPRLVSKQISKRSLLQVLPKEV